MDQKQKKLLRLGLILVALIILENLAFYHFSQKKRKLPPPRPKASHGPNISPSSSPSPSPFPKKFQPIVLPFEENEDLEEIPRPTPSPQHEEPPEDEDFDFWFLIATFFNFAGTLAFLGGAIAGYRWLLSKLEAPDQAIPGGNPLLKTGPSLDDTKEDPKSNPKPQPSEVHVPRQPGIRLRPNAILIDEDPKIHAHWLAVAKSRNKTVLAFHSVADFMKQSTEIALETDLFIDIELGGGQLGSPRSQKISEAGFKRIFLTTSGPITHDIPKWVSMIVSKNPPWGGVRS
jgi:hypothetical protein